jgi:predicted nucleic acid-binding protein
MIKALIDTNIIIDIALTREPFHSDAAKLFQKIDEKKIEGYISTSGITDIFYLLRKSKGYLNARKDLLGLTQILDILAVTRNTILNALLLDIKDFENAVQIQAATENKIDVIITRNLEDFRNLRIPQVLTPRDFVKNY